MSQVVTYLSYDAIVTEMYTSCSYSKHLGLVINIEGLIISRPYVHLKLLDFLLLRLWSIIIIVFTTIGELSFKNLRNF